MNKYVISVSLLLLSSTSLAQDSCMVRPSCADMGYTKSASDCAGKKAIACPFDASVFYCPEVSGSGGGEADGDTIEMLCREDTNTFITFTYGGGSIEADCGNGTIVTGPATDNGTITCSNLKKYDYYLITLRGDFTYYGGNAHGSTTGSGCDYRKINKKGITKINNIILYDSTPYLLPSTLIDASFMFKNPKRAAPRLTEGLEIEDYMLSNGNVFGNIKIPSSLKSAERMFYKTWVTGIVEFPQNNQLENVKEMFKNDTNNRGKLHVYGLENLKITDATSMFESADVVSVSGLPPNLTIGKSMFEEGRSGSCKLTSIPELPKTLTDGSYMFYGCANLTGTLPDYSNFPNLTNVTQMFYGTKIKQAANPSWPAEAFE